MHASKMKLCASKSLVGDCWSHYTWKNLYMQALEPPDIAATTTGRGRRLSSYAVKNKNIRTWKWEIWANNLPICCMFGLHHYNSIFVANFTKWGFTNQTLNSHMSFRSRPIYLKFSHVVVMPLTVLYCQQNPIEQSIPRSAKAQVKS